MFPTYFSKDDKAWLQEMFNELPIRARKEVAESYSLAFDEAFNAEPVKYKKENRARYSANTWLREHVKRYRSVVKCEVSEPPTAL